MTGLPLLPGNSFRDPTLQRFHRTQTLNYKNGYSQPLKPEVGIGGRKINYNQLSEGDLEELSKCRPTLTYGQVKEEAPDQFVPAFVAWDKKVLRFYAWFKQTVNESPSENHRVRHVNIYYYLEDDTIAVVEPHNENFGMTQGKLVRRSRLPKNDVGDSFTWKDLNMGMDVTFYGRTFHIYDCDRWTREWLESEGIEVNPPEPSPNDPYMEGRHALENRKKMKSGEVTKDKLGQFLEMDGKVLRFYAVWDDRDKQFGELRKFIIHFYLTDDTLEVREVHQANDGRDPYPLLIARGRVPADRYDLDSPEFPHAVLEISDKEVKRYIEAIDLMIGKTVCIYNRRFLIYDCDNFTKAFFWKHFNITDFTPIDVSQPRKPLPLVPLPPPNGYGTDEDSLNYCFSFQMTRPKFDTIKKLENQGVLLRFEVKMDSPLPEHNGRRFILSYRLSDDQLSLFEPYKRNAGMANGKFLEFTRVPKPDSTETRPTFYGPEDFFVGNALNIFKNRFIVTGADSFAVRFVEDHPRMFSDHLIKNLQAHRIVEDQDPRFRGIKINHPKLDEDRDICKVVHEILVHLKKLHITAATRKDHTFLNINVDRNGCITERNMCELLGNMNLPNSEDVVREVMHCVCPQNPTCIELEVFRKYLEA